VAIKYEPDVAEGHYMLGATVWETTTFNKINEYNQRAVNGNCDCNFCSKEVERLGLKGTFHKELFARHCKHF
jgi:hypothetical protein